HRFRVERWSIGAGHQATGTAIGHPTAGGYPSVLFAVLGLGRPPRLAWLGPNEVARQATSRLDLPRVPLDQRSYHSSRWAVVPGVESSGRYQVIACSRSTGELRIYESLRSYFIAQVEDEVKLSSE